MPAQNHKRLGISIPARVKLVAFVKLFLLFEFVNGIFSVTHKQGGTDSEKDT
jgi:hypothetical protein